MLNGLILETLEDIPDGDVSIRIADMHFKVLRSDDQAIRTVKIFHPAQPTTAKRAQR